MRRASGCVGLREQVHAEEARRDRADQAEDRDDREPQDRVRLAAQAVGVEVVVHVRRFGRAPRRRARRCAGARAQAEQRARLRLVRHLVEPVAVREAQEDFHATADRALEAPSPTPCRRR